MSLVQSGSPLWGGEVWGGVVGGGGALWWEGGVLSLGTSKLACTRLI